jgi:hypothetical protein
MKNKQIKLCERDILILCAALHFLRKSYKRKVKNFYKGVAETAYMTMLEIRLEEELDRIRNAVKTKLKKVG